MGIGFKGCYIKVSDQHFPASRYNELLLCNYLALHGPVKRAGAKQGFKVLNGRLFERGDASDPRVSPVP